MNINYESEVTIALPLWAQNFAHRNDVFNGDAHKMRLAIELSKANVEHNTGGPFGAAIFNMDSNELVAIGVNVVVPGKCSLAHGEIVAIMLAQQTLGTFSLAAQGGRMELFTSAQPCVQCWGAMHWSGLQRLVYGATGTDVREITGFDEGPLPEDWAWDLHYAKLPIEVTHTVLRKHAKSVLRSYAGLVYNPAST